MANYQFAIFNNEYLESFTVAKTLKEQLSKFKVKENVDHPDIVFVIGGDGTFLRAVHYYNKQLDKVRFITFNQGKIGFYHSFSVEQINQVLADLNDNKVKFIIKELDLLETWYENQVYYAINEVRLVNFNQTLNTQVWVNEELLQTFRGSGLIFSTKTGTTGLMRSAGGAVILANHKLMECKELFPVNNVLYNTINSPLILDNKQTVTLKLNNKIIKKPNNTQLVVDTFVIHDKLITEIKVQLSNMTLKLLAYDKQDDSLISKLNKTFIKFSNK